MVKKKVQEIQVKFTVNEEQKARLDALAKQREVSVPQFAKLSALGVRMTPSPTIEILEENLEEKELLEEILSYYDEHGYENEVLFISSGLESNVKTLKKIKEYLKNK